MSMDEYAIFWKRRFEESEAENERLRSRDQWAALLDEIRGDVSDEVLRERLVEIQGYLRHGKVSR